MKRIILPAIIMSLCLFSSAQAGVLKGKAVDEISTSKPKDIINITVLKKVCLDQDIVLKKGYVLSGKMLNITEPEKWHKNASFTFIPTSYTDLDGNSHKIDKEIKTTYRQKMKPDYKHSEITAGPWMFSPAYIDDAKKLMNGETKEVWEDYSNRSTPWSKGIQIDIKPNETIYFNIPD